MTLVYCNFNSGGMVDLYCEKCQCWVGTEELSVVSDMVLRSYPVLCFDCDQNSADVVPSQLYYLDDHFLLGLGDKSFLVNWMTDYPEELQTELHMSPISQATWYSLKSGDLRLVTVRPSLSS